MHFPSTTRYNKYKVIFFHNKKNIELQPQFGQGTNPGVLHRTKEKLPASSVARRGECDIRIERAKVGGSFRGT